jgi:hypothetical protein
MGAIIPPTITKARALQHLEAEHQRAGIVDGRGVSSALARMLGISRVAVGAWPRDEPIPELQAWRLRALRPAWFETASA